MKALTSINLSFGLLNIPIKIYPLRDNKTDNVDFVGLSNCCKHETGLKRYCKSCDNPLEWKTDLKGYKISKNNYVLLTKEELESIEKLENGIEILYFVNADEVNLSCLDVPYLLEAEQKNNFIKLYSLFNAVLSEQNKYAVCRAVVKGKEHFAIIRHESFGLVLQHIERISEITIKPKTFEPIKAELEQIKLIVQSNTKEFDFGNLNPIYVTKVREVIESKAQGKPIEIKAVTAEEVEGNLLDTLKQMSRKAMVKEVE